MSASTTNRCPRPPTILILSRACVALLFGLNPYELALKSASKIGSMTIFAAICTTRSRTVGMPRGLCRPSCFAMYRRRTGCGRYRPDLRRFWISSRNPSTPCCSILDSVSPSIPAAPRFALTRFHASWRTSLRQIRSYRAWKRRPRLRLADMKSLRWSFRTLSMGVLGLPTMPSFLPPVAGATKAGPLPSGGVLAPAITGTTSPRTPFPHGPLSPSAYGGRLRLMSAAG